MKDSGNHPVVLDAVDGPSEGRVMRLNKDGKRVYTFHHKHVHHKAPPDGGYAQAPYVNQAPPPGPPPYPPHAHSHAQPPPPQYPPHHPHYGPPEPRWVAQNPQKSLGESANSFLNFFFTALKIIIAGFVLLFLYSCLHGVAKISQDPAFQTAPQAAPIPADKQFNF